MIWPFNKERRQWPRRAVRLDVMYGTAPPLTLTTTVDLSAHGMAFRAAKPYERGTLLEVQVLLNPQHPDTGWFYADGKVARCEGGIVAVEVSRVSAEDARKIDLFFSRMKDINPTA